MAYLPFDPRRSAQSTALQAAPSAGTAPAQSAPVASSGGGSSPSAAAPAQQDTGSGWTNLQNYLAPNASAANAMGQQYAGNLTTQANDATKSLQDYADQKYAYDKSVVQGSPGAYPDRIPSDAKAGATDKAFADAGTQSGAQAYLAGQYGNQGNYTQGMKSLDAWLLNQEGMGAINDAQSAWQKAQANAAPKAYQQIMPQGGQPRMHPTATPAAPAAAPPPIYDDSNRYNPGSVPGAAPGSGGGTFTPYDDSSKTKQKQPPANPWANRYG